MEIIYDADLENFYKTYEVVNSMLDYTSPKNEFHICRYCTSKNPSFKSRAHLFPEFTGNKTLFAYNECDECNKKFGLYETNLSAFSGIKNTFIPIKSKKKYPKFKSNDGKLTTQFHKDNKVIAEIDKNSELFKFENGVLTLNTETQTFTPLYVYKGLVKFALSLLKKEDIIKFKKTFDWINQPSKKIDDNLIPLLLIYNESRPPIIKPIAILSKKRNNEFNSPEFSFIFGFGFHRFQIFLPFNSTDEQELDKEKIILPLNFDFVTQKMKNEGKWGFGHFDMNSLNKVRLSDIFKINFTPSKDDPLFK